MRAKKIIFSLLILAVLAAMSAVGTITAFASEENITVTVNGDTLSFDQPPIIKDGRTLVPLRAIFEALGAEVEWIDETQTIAAQMGEVTIVMVVGQNQFIKETGGDGGVIYDLDVAPEILNERTLVPARAVAEALDCTVDWDDDTWTVTIISEEWLKGKNSPTNACIHNGVVYYSFIYQPYIYAYDGAATKTYAAGGAPLGIVVYNNSIYYINSSNNTISSIDLQSGEREIVFARLNDISDFAICGGKMLIIGSDAEEKQQIYRLDLKSGKADIIYERPNEIKLLYERNGSNFILWKNRLFVVESITPLACAGDVSCKIYMIDPIGGKSVESVKITGVSEMINAVAAKLNNRLTSTEFKFDENYAYFHLTLADYENSAKYGEVDYHGEYYMISLDDGTAKEIAEDDYAGITDIFSETDEEWTYGNDKAKVYRTNNKSGVTETLLSGSNYYYLTNDNKWLVVLRAESAGGTPTSTKGYKSAEVYVMDVDGNNIRTVNSYSQSSGSASPAGNIDTEHLEPETCAVCGGSGKVTCSYCRGSGNAMPITVIGMQTEQKCTYCGGTGERICIGCGGSGQK